MVGTELISPRRSAPRARRLRGQLTTLLFPSSYPYALVSTYLEGRSAAEVAKAFVRPRAGVESTIEKGLRTLRKKMTEQDETRAPSGRGAKRDS